MRKNLRRIAAALALVTLLLPNVAIAEGSQGPGPTVVGIYLNHVFAVDVKGSSFTVDFYIWFRWKGEDWHPLDSFELTNGRITSKTGVVKKQIGDEHYVACRVLATITKFWDLRRFPLDSHTLSLEIEDSDQDTRSMVYQADEANAGISPELQLPGFIVKRSGGQVSTHVYHTNYGDTSFPSNRESSWSRYVFSVDVVRPGIGRFLKVFFGLFISVLISWCGFWVRPKESSPRVSLGVGATFAAAAVTVAINNSLPDTNDVTMADKLVMLTLGIIVASVAETILALFLFARGKERLQIGLDRACGILFPLFYLSMLLAIVK
jgi:hypothetical protein